ncbi:MAG: DUF805 domain-containing protein [Kiritimatiellia bacterium]
MNWYLTCWKKYATFSGRARRKEYWMFILFNFLAYVVAGALDAMFGGGLITGLYCLAVFLPSFAVFVRRLHDTNKSGWWILISLVPVIGSIWLLIILLSDSSLGSNKYGSNPKAA